MCYDTVTKRHQTIWHLNKNRWEALISAEVPQAACLQGLGISKKLNFWSELMTNLFPWSPFLIQLRLQGGTGEFCSVMSLILPLSLPPQAVSCESVSLWSHGQVGLI